MTIDRRCYGGGYAHQAWRVSNVDPQAAQILGEDRSASCKRDLGQQPEGVEKRRITRGRLQTGLGGFCGQCSYFADACAETKFVNDLVPFP